MSASLDNWLEPAFDEPSYGDGIGDGREIPDTSEVDNGYSSQDRDMPTADEWEDVFGDKSDSDSDSERDTDTPTPEDWENVFDSGGSDSESDDSKEDEQSGDSGEGNEEDSDNSRDHEGEPDPTEGKDSGKGPGIDIAQTIEKFLELGLKLLPKIVDIAQGKRFDDIPIKVPTGGKPSAKGQGRKKGERETIEIRVLDEIKRLVDGQ